MKRIEFKVYKLNGSKCIRKFESLDDAKTWCWLRESGNHYRIEWTEPFGNYGKTRDYVRYE